MLMNIYLRMKLPTLGLLIIVFLLSGCGSISSKTVELSTEITARIKDIETAHIYAVNSYFDSERQRIEEFMDNVWIPLFLRNFLGQSMILEDLKKVDSIGANTRAILAAAAEEYLTDPAEANVLAGEIVDALNSKREDEDVAIRTVVHKYVPSDKQDAAAIHIASLMHVETPAVLIMEFSEAANEQILAQRQELLGPIEKARAATLQELIIAYSDIYAGQGVITGRLEAAARKSEQQANLVNALGGEGTAATINKKISKLAEGVNGAFDEIAKFEEKIEPGDDSSNKADDLLNQLKQGLKKAIEESGLSTSK